MEILHHDHRACVLHERFESLWNQQTLCDVTLSSQEGTEIHAHFLYLAVHSPYFHQELSSVREKSTFSSTSASLHIDVPSCILQNILNYLYKGELVITEGNFKELEQTAAQLKLEDVTAMLRKSKYFKLQGAPDSSKADIKVEESHIGICSDDKGGDRTSHFEHCFKQSSEIDSQSSPCNCEEDGRFVSESSLDKKSHEKSTKNTDCENNIVLSLFPYPVERPCLSSAVESGVNEETVTKVKRQTRGRNRTVLKEGNTGEDKSGTADRSRRCRPVKDDCTPGQGLRRSSRVRKGTRQVSYMNLSNTDTEEDFNDGQNLNYESGDCSEWTSDSLKKQKSKSKLSKNVILPPEGRNVSPPRRKSMKSRSNNVSSFKEISRVMDFNKKVEKTQFTATSKQKLKTLKNHVIHEQAPKKHGSVHRKARKVKSSGCRHPGSRKKTYLSFQPLSYKICLLYRTSLFTRHAFEASYSKCDHDYEKSKTTWQCCVCKASFSQYSRWRLHYRSFHLIYLLAKLAKIKSLNMKKAFRRKRKQSDGTLMLMNCGKIRKMPGPKCSVSRIDMVKCVECGVMLASRASLKNHLRQYHNMNRQQVEQHRSLLVHCEVSGCAFANIDIQKVERHVRESHPEIRHPCSQCQRSFVRQDLLEQHIRRIHQKLTKFVCSICSQHFKKSCDQKIHEQQAHGINHNFVIFSCSYEGCEYQTITARYLEAHQKSRHLDNRIQCSYCATKVKTKLALQMHVNALHLNKRPYLCEICGSGFCDPWTLQRHIAFRHSTARDYTCKHCSYACNNRIQYMNHTFQQHGVRVEFDTRKELVCPVCSYKALSSSRMNAHIRHIHADPHKYTCEICGKGFKNRHYLRDHQVIHSNSTYQCPHCEYSPWTSSKLKKHIRTQHIFKDVKPYSCPYCTYACALSGNCRKHVSHKHPGLDVRYNTDKDMLAYMRKVEAELQMGRVQPTAVKKV